MNEPDKRSSSVAMEVLLNVSVYCKQPFYNDL